MTYPTKKLGEMNKSRIFLLILLGLVMVAIITFYIRELELGTMLSIFILAVTAWAIAAQAFATEKLADISYMPSVIFILKSGTTYQKQAGNNSPSLEQKLDTRRIVVNKSKFPIYFWFKGYLEIKYKDNSRVTRKENINEEWRVSLGILDGHDSGSMLYRSIMGKNKIDWSTEVGAFQQAMDQIQAITATIEISYAPAARKSLVFKLEPETWRFDLQSFKWIDPLGTSDDRIT